MYLTKWHANTLRTHPVEDGPKRFGPTYMTFQHLNAWIVYKKASGRKISRRKFILQLIEGLRGAYVAQKVTQENTVEQARVQQPSGKRRKCAGKKCNNSRVSICQHCRKPIYRKCGNDDWKLIECKKCLLPQN